MKKLLVVLSAVLANTFLQAQVNKEIDQMYTTVQGEKLRSNKVYIEGSPYLNPSFSDAKVAKVEGNYKMRYNAYLDEIEYTTNTDTLALVKDMRFSEIVFPTQNLHFQLATYPYEGKNVTGYLIKLVDQPTVKIYKKEKINFQDAQPARSSYDEAKPPRYVKADVTYFVKLGDQAIVDLPENKRKLLALFPNKKAQLTEFLKDYKTDYSKSENLEHLAEALK